MIWYTGMRYHTQVVHGCSLNVNIPVRSPVPYEYHKNLKLMLFGGRQEKLNDLFGDQDLVKFYAENCLMIAETDQEKNQHNYERTHQEL